MKFNTLEQLEKTKPLDHKATIAFRKTHLGYNYREKSLLDIEPIDWAICCLHMMLRVVARIFKLAIQDKIKTEDEGLLLRTTLRVIKVKCKKNFGSKKNDKHMTQRTIKLPGHACLKVMTNWTHLIDTMFPPPSQHKSDSLAAMGKWNIIYNTLADQFQSPAEQELKAKYIEELGIDFVNHIVKWSGSKGVNYYMHWLVHHVPTQLRRFDVDLFQLSGQQLEHLNHHHKADRGFTNGKSRSVALKEYKGQPGSIVKDRIHQLVSRQINKKMSRMGRLVLGIQHARQQQQQTSRLARALHEATAISAIHRRKLELWKRRKISKALFPRSYMTGTRQ